jgi:pilus assembly protein Flp/PilA
MTMQHVSQSIYARLVTLFDREEGQTMAEYGIVLALITLAVVGTLTLLGTQINTKLTGVLNALKP